MSDISETDILSLDYGGKVQMLERVGQEILNYQIEFARVSGRYAELRANIEVMKQLKSVLQSSIKAEQPEGGSNNQKHEITRNPLYNKP
ncbi:MAG: hypothetical protein WC998_04655 [Candidatus Paceibacterota bacterium]|jgi:hypothetical protein